jgi:hypothetical protein
MTIYRAGTAYLVTLDANRAFLHRSDTGETTAIAHPQVFVTICKDAMWESVWGKLPESLVTALHEKGLAPGYDPARGSVDLAGIDPR